MQPFQVLPYDNVIRDREHMVQLWFQDALVRSSVVFVKYIDEEEWTRLLDTQVASYPYREFKYWKRYGLTPPESISHMKNNFSIIEFVDTTYVDKSSMLEYRVEYETKEANGEWIAATWQKSYYVDMLSVAES